MTSREVIPAKAGIQSVNVNQADLEVLDLPATRPDRPDLLLLHEGVGSVSMWREFPEELARATGCRTIAYSREGHGRSSRRKAPFTPMFMHDEAFEVLPRLREALGSQRPVLIGHSTGASMALIHAGANRWPVAAVVAMAPLAFVEESNLVSIREARTLYTSTRWREKLGRHHDDVDHAFYGWNDIWLDPAFADWTIAQAIRGIRCPIVAILGDGDQYASPAQLDCIAKNAVNAASFEAVFLKECGHAPHRDQPAAVLTLVENLLDRL
jgi:pimeloyl-ACP methyl ester carboxylesterase